MMHSRIGSNDRTDKKLCMEAPQVEGSDVTWKTTKGGRLLSKRWTASERKYTKRG